MRYILPPKEMHDVSRNLVKFWETNISSTVGASRDIVAMKDKQKIVYGLSNGTIVNALE